MTHHHIGGFGWPTTRQPPPPHLRPLAVPPHAATQNLGTVSQQRSEPSPTATPLLDAVAERARRTHEASFHVPGHKRGRSVHPRFQQLTEAGMLRHDLTEISGLDYLASPSGPIRSAQQLAARTFHADHTWLLVNGSTVGIHASILATVGAGNTLLVARNCHQSAFAGMVLAGCQPWWLPPELDPELGIAHTVTPQALRTELAAAQAAGRRVGAALVVSPTYFGVCADVAGLAEVCHEHGIPLIVDEAHGAHFGLHPALPRSAMQQGADLAIQSTHKVLSAMTQCAMLHTRGHRVDRARVSKALQMLQTSSPSYVLLSSLDAARAHAEEPEQCFGEPLLAAQVAREGLRSLAQVTLMSDHVTPSPDQQPATADATHPQHDPLRLTVCVSGLGMSGYQAAQELEERFGVVSELATQKVVVFVLGPGSTVMDAEQLVAGLQQLAAEMGSQQHVHGGLDGKHEALQTGKVDPWQQENARLTPKEAFFAPAERVQLELSVGRISAELLCPYPPGVPVLFPGEVITQGALDTLVAALRMGGKVTGAADDTLRTVLCVQQ